MPQPVCAGLGSALLATGVTATIWRRRRMQRRRLRPGRLIPLPTGATARTEEGIAMSHGAVRGGWAPPE
ncbi:hypothetical protein [Streptomyces sp. NPDC001530]|uniref:hypothetical protein n=1 Tax=Streptomyces sp. NPDC001530 TaxID=3364582 RepID=UPI0036D1B2C8